MGKDLFPRLASGFEAGLLSDVVDFKFEGDKFIGTRPLFAGKCLADAEISGLQNHTSLHLDQTLLVSMSQVPATLS